MEDLQERFGLTYLFIAHDLSVVKHISDRVAVMYLGKIVEMADRNELYEDPLHPTPRLSFQQSHSGSRHRETTRANHSPWRRSSPINPPSGCHFHTRCPYAMEVCRQVDPVFADQVTRRLPPLFGVRAEQAPGARRSSRRSRRTGWLA